MGMGKPVLGPMLVITAFERTWGLRSTSNAWNWQEKAKSSTMKESYDLTAGHRGADQLGEEAPTESIRAT